jgi:hypothetical protein
MNARDCAVLAFKLMGVWFAAGGVIGATNIPYYWQSQRAEAMVRVALLGAAFPILFALVVGALLWMNAEGLATRVFGQDPALLAARVFGEDEGAEPSVRRDRVASHPLFALALAVVGVLLLTEAVPQLVYALATYLRSRQTGSAMFGPDPAQQALIWDAAARANLASAVTRFVIGVALLAGPARLSAAYARVRGELKGTLGDEPASAAVAPPAEEGPAGPPSDRIAP